MARIASAATSTLNAPPLVKASLDPPIARRAHIADSAPRGRHSATGGHGLVAVEKLERDELLARLACLVPGPVDETSSSWPAGSLEPTVRC
ncbi:MAG TPA: hypothetical protein VM324_05085 [Egibacteraceae bacterium]|nr:hypothetical protein [Egibacteraceae bacterium]